MPFRWPTWLRSKSAAERSPRIVDSTCKPRSRRLRVEQLESRDLLSTLPAGFQEDLVTGGLYEPTSMVVAPGGRIFVTEKPYDVRIVQNGQLLTTPLLSLSVERGGERGVEGIILDPQFTQNGYFYIYYTHRTANGSFDRLSRFTISTSDPNIADPGSELVLLDGILTSEPGYHNGGMMQFGADGMLYLGIGDTGDTSLPQDLGKLQGKILRLNVAAYPNMVPPDNPYVNTVGARGEIWARGVRNPFTGDMLPGTNRLLVNDVGGDRWEEINEVTRASNYGWPLAEGVVANPGSFTNPLYAYAHDNDQGAAIVGGEFYTGSAFPAAYSGKYFFADYVRGFIKTFDISTNAVASFTDDAFIPVDIANSPDGNLYWLSIGYGSAPNGALYKISYVGANRAPLAVASATPTNGLEPLTVSFDGTASSDPDGDSLTYTWNFGDGQSATGPTTSHIYAAGTYTARLTVSDGQTTGTSLPMTISVGNRAPTPTITLPTAGTTYRAGDTIQFSGSATDPDEGPLGAAAMDWSVTFHHDQHTHPFISSIHGVSSGSFQIPLGGEPDPDQWYRVTLTATDSGGLQSSTFIDVTPITSIFTLATNLTGATLLLDGQPIAAGTATEGVVNMTRSIEAPATQVVGGQMYQFVGWSDGGPARHNIATPPTDATFTAQYQPMALAATYAGTPPAAALPGRTISYSLTVTNVGTATWQYSGTNKVRLGVYFDGRSDAPNDWTKDPVRFSLPRNVAPGESVTIAVSLAAPTTPGAYVLRARMVKEGVAWFVPLQKTDFQVQTLAAAYVGNVPTVWSAKQSQTYQLTVTNTGTATWNAAGTDKVRLAVWFGGSSDTPPTGSSQPIRVALPRDILPGESVTLTVMITAPSSAGNYTLRNRMIKETVGYFSDMLRTAAAVEVFSAKITGTPPTTWQSNQTQTYSLTIKNMGSNTWNTTGSYPVHLAIYFGGSSDTIVGGIDEPKRFDLPRNLSPGQSLTMSVTVVAPSLGGNYVLRARMVKEFVAWGNEILKTNVTVQSLAASYAAAVPTLWAPGETKSYSMTVTNNGTAAWNLTGTNPVHLGVYFGDSNPAPGTGANEPIRFLLAPSNVLSIAPGQSARLTVTMTAPLTPGTYVLRHRLVQEHVSWFSDYLATTITVG